MWLTDSCATEHCRDRWITRSRSGVEIARTERVDGPWETTGPMIHAHEHRFVGGQQRKSSCDPSRGEGT